MLVAPTAWHNEIEHRRRLAAAINGTIDGRGNNGASVTLASGATSTAVTDTKVGSDSVIYLMPTNAAAATEFAAGTLYVSARGNGTFTITSSNAAASRTFDYAILATTHSS